MKRALVLFALCALVSATIARSADTAVVTAQLLDYESGYVFLTTGDGFRVSPAVAVTNIATGSAASSSPRAREYARLTFDATGVVTKIALSQKVLPPEGDLNAIRHFAIALSSPQPNPDLGPQSASEGACGHVIAGRRVNVTFTVQVPPTTRLNDTVYMTTDQSGWNPQAYRLTRTDALHYRTVVNLSSGTALEYLFDRGSMQSIELGQNGIELPPRSLCIGDADAQSEGKQVYHWGDESATGTLPVPQTFPTPFNPAPFPNLPTPQPRPT